MIKENKSSFSLYNCTILHLHTYGTIYTNSDQDMQKRGSGNESPRSKDSSGTYDRPISSRFCLCLVARGSQWLHYLWSLHAHSPLWRSLSVDSRSRGSFGICPGISLYSRGTALSCTYSRL